MRLIDRIASWFNYSVLPTAAFNELQDSLRNARHGFAQVAFLLSQASLLQAPGRGEKYRLQAMITPYVYIHPETFAKITKNDSMQASSAKLPGSPSIFVLTPLMPPMHLICGPNRMPHLEGVPDARQ